MLTRRHGKVRAVAKGVRRTKSKFGARLEPFSHVDLQLYTGRNLDIVSQAESIRVLRQRRRRRLPRLHRRHRRAGDRRPAHRRGEGAVAAAVPAGRRRAAVAGRAAPHPAGLVLDAFLLRAMSVAGWEPALSGCARCGEEGPHRHFSVPAGGTVCPACRPTGSAMPSPVTIELLEALLTGDWDRAEASQGTNRREGSGLVAALLQWHLERGLRSLPLVDRSRRRIARRPAEATPAAAATAQ